MKEQHLKSLIGASALRKETFGFRWEASSGHPSFVFSLAAQGRCKSVACIKIGSRRISTRRMALPFTSGGGLQPVLTQSTANQKVASLTENWN